MTPNLQALLKYGRGGGYAAAAILLLALPLESARAAVHTVIIDSMKYAPEVLEVHSGDTIVFRNDDLVAHTATTVQDGGKTFDTKVLQPGKSRRIRLKAPAGELAYQCLLHPTMKGRIQVSR